MPDALATTAAETVRENKPRGRSKPSRSPALPEPIVVPADPKHDKGPQGQARAYIGDCRELLPLIPEVQAGTVDLVFADPPFNWNRAYDEWDDQMKEDEYLTFTFDWIDLCVKALRPGGAMWINIPDDWAAEIACFLKGRLDRKPSARMHLENWCVWHYRFGQNAVERFINSKVHVFYFVKDTMHEAANREPATVNGKASPSRSPLPVPRSPKFSRTWNPEDVAELSDRAAIYGDARTLSKKDGMPPKLRVPLDVWYGSHFSRIQGNNAERRGYHDNQLPEMYLSRVIRSTSNPGDTVLDPFLGSGTTAVVARALGRNFIGTEFSAKNAKSAMERVAIGPQRDVWAKPGSHTSAIYSPRAGRDIGEMPPKRNAKRKPREA
jgi:site-specific DNA-methyltransferase (adenine-specific)